MSTKPELRFKILTIGEECVGKTSLLCKYVDNVFPQRHIATIGVENLIKTIETNKYKIILNMWDTAGQERFRSLTKNYYNNTNGIIFVYDITKMKSFEGLKSFIKESAQYGEFASVLCGNKLDLQKKREVKLTDAKTFGESKNMPVFETSAKDGTNLDAVFRKLVDEIMKNKSHDKLIKEYGSKSNKNLTITKINNNKQLKDNTGGCCSKKSK